MLTDDDIILFAICFISILIVLIIIACRVGG